MVEMNTAIYMILSKETSFAIYGISWSLSFVVDVKKHDFDWTRYNGGTPTLNSRPTRDHTYGKAKGK